MTRFRYLGDREHIYLGPPVRVMSPGDVVDLTHPPDPAMFEPVPDDGPSDHGPSDDGGPVAAGAGVVEPIGREDESSGPAGAPDGDEAGTGGEPR